MASNVMTASWISAPSKTPLPERITANLFMEELIKRFVEYQI
jgi:hypothetical protein